MKKFIVTLLAVLYLGVSSGATVHFHYCMGRLVEWGFSVKKSDTCSKCGMHKQTAKKCCNEQSKQLKVDNAQQVSVSHIVFQQVPVILPDDMPRPDALVMLPIFSKTIVIHGPPPEGVRESLYLLNRTFRI